MLGAADKNVMLGIFDSLFSFLQAVITRASNKKEAANNLIKVKLTKVGYNFGAAGSEYILKMNAEGFDNIALELFRYQYGSNEWYRKYTDAIHVDPGKVTAVAQIPFLPISFFKTHRVQTGDRPAILHFESSGTTGEVPSRHFIADAALYEASLLQGFKTFYGDPADYAIIALLPSYLERKNASLVHMARVLMRESGHPFNGFYLDEWERLAKLLATLQAAGQKTLLLGVTFALLDFAATYPMRLDGITVMETGGMKGRRAEWTRSQVHDFLKQQWQLPQVHSEYGMTELLSQAYALKEGMFTATPTMKVLVRDMNDPLDVRRAGSGCLNIIDLANVHSCAFIATEDVGSVHADGRFEVLGRMDHAALRGCSLMTV